MPDKKAIIVGLVSSLMIFIILFFGGIYLLRDPLLKETITFSFTASMIASQYPLPYSRAQALKAAQDAMLETLDPFTNRIRSDQYNLLIEESSGKYGGIGMIAAPKDSFILVMSVIEDGPAERAGIERGDRIRAINNQKFFNMSPQEAGNLMRGAVGTNLSLTLLKLRSGEEVDLEIIREIVKLKHIPYYGVTEDNIGYLKISDFEAGTSAEIENCVNELEDENVIGYIIDVTGNPGGFLEEAVSAADIFLDPNQLIVGTDSQSKWACNSYRSLRRKLTDKPIVILTDINTASSAEIFTGAIRGAGRGIIVGDTTYGKGLVQAHYNLQNGDALRLTISRYYFADGRYLNPPDSELSFSGLAPDIALKQNVERKFNQYITSTFFLYDFILENWPELSQYPSNFRYPDTVISMLEHFADVYDSQYVSGTTTGIETILSYLSFESPASPIEKKIGNLRELSVNADRNSFGRYEDLVEFHLRRIVTEWKSGPDETYHHVIVPGRIDIRLAAELLLDIDKYEAILSEDVHMEI
ncbi:MAG: S41 family peptidase [candidate division Zixibacteria bacterium]